MSENITHVKSVRCAIYDRVSTDLQVKEGLSLEAQKKALTDYATARRYEIVGYYADEGITARKKMQNRKELVRLLNDVKADKIDLILVTKLDRWFRNIKDYHNTQAILEAHHCNWKTIFEEYDTSTANGRFAINIMLSVNENECDRDSDRIKAVFEYKKQRHEHLNGRPAFGYTVNHEKKLIKDPETRSIVEDTFQHYFSTYSKKDTIEYITAKYADVPHAPTQYQVNGILQNETYSGCKFGIDSYCEAYITPAQYKKMKEISDSKRIRNQTEPYLFSSMIKCPVCGKNMSGFVKREHLKNGGISEYKRYRCASKYKEYHNGACLSESVIDAFLKKHILDKLEVVCLQLCVLKDEPRKGPLYAPAKIKKEIERLNNMYQKGRITDTYYDEQYLSLNRKLEAAAETTANITEDRPQPFPEILTGGWAEIYEMLDIVHKKAFWKSTVKEITIDTITHKICGFKFLI